MLHLEIKHLRLVSQIAELGNVTRAAQLLCVSQPALSKQLAELEDRLGFALFHRTRKAMRLTEPGAGFYAHAKKILADMLALETELQGYGTGATGKLRISIDSVHHAAWLPSVMAQFRADHPGIALEVKQVAELLHSLQHKDIDVAIIGEAIAANGINYLPLNEDELVAVLPLAHPLCEKAYISVHDLAGMDMIYYFDLEESYLYRRYLYPNHIRLGSFQRIASIAAIIELVKSGEGMSILPRHLVAHAARQQTLAVRPIGPGGFRFTWYAAFARESKQAYLAAFVGLLQSRLCAATDASGRGSQVSRSSEPVLGKGKK